MIQKNFEKQKTASLRRLVCFSNSVLFGTQNSRLKVGEGEQQQQV
jgi:hypothetical protein